MRIGTYSYISDVEKYLLVDTYRTFLLYISFSADNRPDAVTVLEISLVCALWPIDTAASWNDFLAANLWPLTAGPLEGLDAETKPIQTRILHQGMFKEMVEFSFVIYSFSNR